MINEYIFKGISKHNVLFKELKLTNQQIENYINYVKTYDELKNVFKYYNSNVLELLRIINNNITKIIELYRLALEHKKNKGKNEKISDINFSELVHPDKNDNIVEIIGLINSIIKKIPNENKLFIYFSPSFFEYYIIIYNLEDMKKLIIIKDLICELKKYYESFKLKKEDINKNIHNTGVALCKRGKFNNIDILYFIKQDECYLCGLKNFENNGFLNIFEKLDINKINEEFQQFLKKWKIINWVYIFKNEYLVFAKKIISLVKEMKYFHLLLKLLLLPAEKLRKKQPDLINMLQYKFIEILSPNIKEQYPNYTNDLIELIYLTDKYCNNIESFSKKLYEKFPPELINEINEIYMEYLTKYKPSGKLEKIIVNSIINNKNEHHYLIDLFQRCPKSKNTIIPRFENYNLKKELIYKEDNESINLVQELLKKDLFNDKSLEKYINYNKTILNNLKKEIENYNINYNEIEHFFGNEENKLLFKNRLLMIYLMDDNKSEEKFQLISNRFYDEKRTINDLKLLIEDEKFFFTRNQNFNIGKVKQLIENIKKSNLNYCQNNQELMGYLN